MTNRNLDVLTDMICISDNFLEVNSAQNSKKSERIGRASFVDYVSEVVTRPSVPGLHSSSSTLTSVAREASVRSDLAPANGNMGRPARPVSVTNTGSKYKYSGKRESCTACALPYLYIMHYWILRLGYTFIRSNAEKI